jgi:hypothetical protein
MTNKEGPNNGGGDAALIPRRLAEVVPLVVRAEKVAGLRIDEDHLAVAPDAGCPTRRPCPIRRVGTYTPGILHPTHDDKTVMDGAPGTVLYSEDMQDGQKINSLTIRNPFLKRS